MFYNIMIESIFQAGLQGVQNGIDQFGRAAQQIATSSNVSSSDATSLVDLKQAQTNVEASAKVIKVADETLGSIIDELA